MPIGQEAGAEHLHELRSLLLRLGQNLVEERVRCRGEGEAVFPRLVALAVGHPVDLVEPVQGRDTRLDRRTAANLHLEGQEVREDGQVRDAGRRTGAVLAPDPGGEDVPRQLPDSGRWCVGHRGDLHVQAPVADGEGTARRRVLGVGVVLGDPALQIPACP